MTLDNERLLAPAALDDQLPGFLEPTDDVRDPLDTILNNQADPDYPANYWPYMYAQVRRHNGGGNYSFFDGHAKWAKPETMSPKQFQCEGLLKKFIRPQPPTPIT